ncbi:MAG: heat-inducible transcriptional repressor HrcA [Xylanivirga thermophila]|uniref:heat-inducible transcriptional repressor HrcA n=1 Tax=Xylanivirga thermophila TaxID=2496273 RepID=UPI00101D36F2|nr:heat-inducible transcriptional repressor HrcA [Xylanivirga thermophila]
MELGDRKLRILQAIIDDYIISAEPVGSRTIAKKYGIGISSATIRNEMADLEEMGYLEQPHTSAGRIPSDKAYRLYVDRLMQVKTLSTEQALFIKRFYDEKNSQLEDIISQTARVISDITDYTSVVLRPQLNKILIKRIQLIPIDQAYGLLVVVTDSGIIRDSVIRLPEGIEPGYLDRISNMLSERFANRSCAQIDLEVIPDMRREIMSNRDFFNNIVDALTESMAGRDKKEIFLGGASNIFNFPEYHDIEKAKTFLDILEETEFIYDIIDKLGDNGVSITIGEENEFTEMQNCSIVTATYHVGDRMVGTIGVIGPTRMHYSKVVSVMEYMEKALTQYLTKLYGE